MDILEVSHKGTLPLDPGGTSVPDDALTTAKNILGRATWMRATVGDNFGMSFLAMTRARRRVAEPFVATHDAASMGLVTRANKRLM